MITTRPSKFSIVLKEFVNHIYGPQNINKLLQTTSMVGLVKLYIDENIKHGASLYKELETVENLLNPKTPRYMLRNLENDLIFWMQKIVNERVGQKQN